MNFIIIQKRKKNHNSPRSVSKSAIIAMDRIGRHLPIIIESRMDWPSNVHVFQVALSSHMILIAENCDRWRIGTTHTEAPATIEK